MIATKYFAAAFLLAFLLVTSGAVAQDSSRAPSPAAVDSARASVNEPDVSPIQQFKLNGAFSFMPRADQTKSLDIPTSGQVELARANPKADSSQWQFDAVAGTSFVRIRNKSENVVLKDEGGRLLTVPAVADTGTTHWTLQPVDGQPFVQIQNRDTRKFLVVAGGVPALVDNFQKDGDSHWQLSSPGAVVSAAAAPALRIAYDAALANCNGLGGYWSGSSCRVASDKGPPDCGRGWAWSAETGECYWNGGGRCPPWQTSFANGCQADMTCRGGRLHVSNWGHASCDCPSGAVVWGRYPQLNCVRRVPVAAAIANVAKPGIKVIGNTASPATTTTIAMPPPAPKAIRQTGGAPAAAGTAAAKASAQKTTTTNRNAKPASTTARQAVKPRTSKPPLRCGPGKRLYRGRCV